MSRNGRKRFLPFLDGNIHFCDRQTDRQLLLYINHNDDDDHHNQHPECWYHVQSLASSWSSSTTGSSWSLSSYIMWGRWSPLSWADLPTACPAALYDDDSSAPPFPQSLLLRPLSQNPLPGLRLVCLASAQPWLRLTVGWSAGTSLHRSRLILSSVH